MRATRMADTHHARDGQDVEAAVAWALAEKKSLEIVGHGSKRALGRPAQVDATLDLSALSGITLYEPEELVLSARAGTPPSSGFPPGRGAARRSSPAAGW